MAVTLSFKYRTVRIFTNQHNVYRATISEWVNDPKPNHSWVNIGGDKALNGFQRRLIYQLVKSEFPGYRTYGRNDGSFMQIVKTDPNEEAKVSLIVSNDKAKQSLMAHES